MGDEIALLNDYDYRREDNHQDGRWLHRPKMEWALSSLKPKHIALANTVKDYLQDLARKRQNIELLSADHELEFLPTDTPACFATLRRSGSKYLLAISNFSSKPQTLSQQFLETHLGSSDAIDALTQEPFKNLELPPFKVVWLMNARD